MGMIFNLFDTLMLRTLSLCLLIVGVFVGAAVWWELLFRPLYSDPRFPPTDKLHAGCTQSADILISTNQEIQDIHVVLQFDPTKIDILRVIPDNKNVEEIIDFDIRYGEIGYTHSNMIYHPWHTIKLFGLIFNSHPSSEEVDFVFSPESYFINPDGEKIDLEGEFSVSFAPVPECDPDVVPPSVTMIRPIPGSTGVALDSLFVFDIQDIGKGVDIETVSVLIDEDLYTIDDAGMVMSGNFFVLQPRTWLPVGKQISITVSASDLQVFGWANTTQKTFLIDTAESVVLEENINPIDLRIQSRAMRQYHWTADECRLLRSFQDPAEPIISTSIDAILYKLACNFDIDDEVFYHSSADIDEPQTFSLFAVLWWILFVIVAILKVHYFVSYKAMKYSNNTPPLS